MWEGGIMGRGMGIIHRNHKNAALNSFEETQRCILFLKSLFETPGLPQVPTSKESQLQSNLLPYGRILYLLMPKKTAIKGRIGRGDRIRVFAKSVSSY